MERSPHGEDVVTIFQAHMANNAVAREVVVSVEPECDIALKGDYPRAEPLYQEAIDLTLSHLERTAYVQSEHQQMIMGNAVLTPWPISGLAE